jgi:dephospho-CoA kinase
MQIIGLIGGIASGKSMVAEQLASCGAKILNADKIGHEVLREPKIEAAVRERWGQKVFQLDGRIDRGRLAQIVFAPSPDGPKQRKYLEQLTHPEIIRIIDDELTALAKTTTEVVVIDAALILELGLDKLCTIIIYVDTPRETRLERAIARGWRKEDFTAREATQKSLDFKQNRADLVINNSGSPEQTQAQVDRLWQTLIR